MASATPPNGLRSPKKVPNGQKRVQPAIPLHYPNHRRGTSKVVTQETTTPAKSEKSDAGSGDERSAVNGGGIQHPMTPESLSSSIHRAEDRQESQERALPAPEQTSEAANEAHDTVDGIISIPALEPQLTARPTSAHSERHATALPAKTNGEIIQANGNLGESSNNEKSSKTKPRSDSKPLRVLQAPPPEFHPAEHSSTPLSSHSSHMGQPGFYPPTAPIHDNLYQPYAPQMPPRPFPTSAFNPEALFQPTTPLAPHMSRTPSHTSSSGRPMNGTELPTPIMPMAGSTINEIRLQGAVALQDHILQSFDREVTSDLAIVFTPSKSNNSRGRRILVHALVVQRSKKLWDLITALEKPNRTVHIEAANHFMTETGFVGAVRYLYGAPLWFPETLFGELGQLAPEFLHGAPSGHVLPHVLSYIASGHYLGIPDVVLAGLACVRRLQTWDTVVQCLAFGLEGGIGKQWSLFTASLGDSDSAVNDISTEPIYGEAATHILHDTLVWLAMAIPPTFQFSPTATQLPELPRLPIVIANRPSQADPRLSLIQFGDLALEETGRPDYLTVLVSNILVSLPFVTLPFLFAQPMFRQKALDHEGVVRAVVNERESRRKQVLSAKRLKDADNPILWEATKWEEKVVQSHDYPGFRLRRERVTELPDASAGA